MKWCKYFVNGFFAVACRAWLPAVLGCLPRWVAVLACLGGLPCLRVAVLCTSFPKRFQRERTFQNVFLFLPLLRSSRKAQVLCWGAGIPGSCFRVPLLLRFRVRQWQRLLHLLSQEGLQGHLHANIRPHSFVILVKPSKIWLFGNEVAYFIRCIVFRG